MGFELPALLVVARTFDEVDEVVVVAGATGAKGIPVADRVAGRLAVLPVIGAVFFVVEAVASTVGGSVSFDFFFRNIAVS